MEDAEESENSTSEDLKWYDNLKLQFIQGKLKLNRSKPMDNKLIILLEAKQIQPYEIVRLRNIFTLWEKHNVWEKGFKQCYWIP
jgi:hypothetical protein